RAAQQLTEAAAEDGGVHGEIGGGEARGGALQVGGAGGAVVLGRGDDRAQETGVGSGPAGRTLLQPVGHRPGLAQQGGFFLGGGAEGQGGGGAAAQIAQANPVDGMAEELGA